MQKKLQTERKKSIIRLQFPTIQLQISNLWMKWLKWLIVILVATDSRKSFDTNKLVRQAGFFVITQNKNNWNPLPMCSITIYQAALPEKADNALFVLDFSPSLNQPKLTAEQSDLVVCESHSKGPFRASQNPWSSTFYCAKTDCAAMQTLMSKVKADELWPLGGRKSHLARS